MKNVAGRTARARAATRDRRRVSGVGAIGGVSNGCSGGFSSGRSTGERGAPGGVGEVGGVSNGWRGGASVGRRGCLGGSLCVGFDSEASAFAASAVQGRRRGAVREETDADCSARNKTIAQMSNASIMMSFPFKRRGAVAAPARSRCSPATRVLREKTRALEGAFPAR
jgi:hypothetical protein